MAKANPVAGASQIIHSAGGAGAKSDVQASSPHDRRSHEPSQSSGRRNRQMQLYDPAIAIAGNASPGQGSAGARSAGRGHLGNANVGRCHVGRSGDSGRGGDSAGNGGRPFRRPAPRPPRPNQGAGTGNRHQHRDNYNDDRADMDNAGYYRPNALARAGPLRARLGPRQLAPDDARNYLN